MKYTGKMPTAVKSPEGSRPSTPSFRGFNALRQRGIGRRSPLDSSSSFTNQQAGVEALFQGAAKGAKGMLERGEKLGINQAVRDAMGEIRRNMQGFNESRYVPRPPKEVLTGEGAARALAVMERRNLQLASMLDDTMTSLKAVSASNLDDKAKSLELIEVAAAKIQFVKIYLEDPTMEVPVLDRPMPDQDQMETDEKPAAEEAEVGPKAELGNTDEVQISSLSLADDEAGPAKAEPPKSPPGAQAMDTSGAEAATDPLSAGAPAVARPPPVPTRSTLAQSSFSWMLESHDPSPSHSRLTSRSPPGSGHSNRKRQSNNASREKNAFLFGEVTADSEGKDPLKADDIFGMEPLRKKK